ncbi:MAG TPA: tetratricopeptide repeat protein [Candidatus Binataceae bacterium]|nr:tetratricopeptide repeat protein [Candidatus Binataceae bacterium]
MGARRGVTLTPMHRRGGLSARFCSLLAAAGLLAVLLGTAAADAQTLEEFNQRLLASETRLGSALNDPRAGEAMAEELDRDEAQFANYTADPRASTAQLGLAYQRLDGMLEKLYRTWRDKHNACLTTIGNGGQCDYEQPEQLELRTLYPLSWLRFHASVLFRSQPQVRRRMLEQAIAGFSQSTLVLLNPDLIRENLLGRAFCERDLGQFDHAQYVKALADFNQVLKAGPHSAQYVAAQQGLATTYAAMGAADKAAAISASLAQNAAAGGQQEGSQLFRLEELLKAESASQNPLQRTKYHREAVDVLRQIAHQGQAWPAAVAAVIRYVQNPTAELGGGDPFESYLLASVLYTQHQAMAAAHYFLLAARSGRYPQAYKYAVEIYYSQRRYDLIDPVLQNLVAQRRAPLADWAGYMRFKLARQRREQSGRQNQALRQLWIGRARDYLARFPHGQYAYEPRFRLAELLQQQGQYGAAAAQYDQVTGDKYYDFAAAFNAAQCRYQLLAAAWQQASSPSLSALSKTTRAALEAVIARAPKVAQQLPAQRQFIVDSRGRATYMLAALLVRQRPPNQQRIAQLLDGFQRDYPSLESYFDDTIRWRLSALLALGQFAQAQQLLAPLLSSDARPQPSADFLKELGMDCWNEATARRASGDRAGTLASARLTVLLYDYFARAQAAGIIPARDLTGTLSILGEAEMELGDNARAQAIFTTVVQAVPTSPDANAGLARLAQARGDYKEAAERWSAVENNAAESDVLWYEAQYQLALIYAHDGNIAAACGKLANTRSAHPSLDGPEMRGRWDALQHKLCLTKVRS